jgi:hypothetical protein
MKFFKSLVVGLVVFGLNNYVMASFSTDIADDFIKNNQKNIGISNNEIKALKTIENAYKYSDSSKINSSFLSNEFLNEEQKHSVKQLGEFKIGDTNLGELVESLQSYENRRSLIKDSFGVMDKTLNLVKLKEDTHNEEFNKNINNSLQNISNARQALNSSRSISETLKEQGESVVSTIEGGWSLSRATFLNSKLLKGVKNIAKYKDISKLVGSAEIANYLLSAGKAIYKIETDAASEDIVGDLFSTVESLTTLAPSILKDKGIGKGSKYAKAMLEIEKIRKEVNSISKLSKINRKILSDSSNSAIGVLSAEMIDKVKIGVLSIVAELSNPDTVIGTSLSVSKIVIDSLSKRSSLSNKYTYRNTFKNFTKANEILDKSLVSAVKSNQILKNDLADVILNSPNLETELGWKKAEKPIAKKDSEEEKQAKKEKALKAKNEILAKNKEKQEAKQKQENAKKLAEQTEEVAKLKKAVQTAENLREKNTKLAEQYANNPTTANKNALDKSGREFANARDDVSEYDNGEYAQTHKYENSFTVDKDRQIKQNFDTALGDMSQEQKDILARADYDSDDFAEGVIEREQAGRDYAQEQADFYALGGGEDKLKDEKDLASLEDFFDKLLKDDDLADVNDDEKKQIDDSEKNDDAARRDSYIHLSFIGEYTGDNPYKNALIHSVNESDSNNKINATETIEPRPGRITGGDIVITPQLTNGYKYTAWGQWSLPNLLHIESDGRESKIHQGYYIIGERPTIEIPKTGNASYLGELRGDYVGNDNSVDLNSISGSISMNVNFGTQYLDADLVVKKDNSTWANAHFENVYIKHTNNRGNGQFDQHDRDKSGNSVTGGGWGSLEGYFLGDGSEAGGAFIVQKDNDGRASGVFRAKKQ